MENPNTWTLLHHDLARASGRTFSSLEEKAEVLAVVLENHKINASKEEVAEIIENYAKRIEQTFCGKSLIATIVDVYQSK